MSLADNIFIDMCKDVIENGTSTEGERCARCGKMVPLLIPLNVSEL